MKEQGSLRKTTICVAVKGSKKNKKRSLHKWQIKVAKVFRFTKQQKMLKPR